MNKEFRYTVMSTLMVAVLSIQQLFGAYHMLIFHANDFLKDQPDGQEWVISGEDPCDLCAKLNPNPVVYAAVTITLAHNTVFFLIHESREQLTSVAWYDTRYRRGPPSSSFYSI